VIHLSVLDGFVIAAFIALILALGFSAKLLDRTVLGYLAAGRRLTLPAFVATLVSTWYGGVLAIGDSVKAYGVGTFLLMGVPYYVFALIYAFWFAKRVRGAEQISIPERFALRFGNRAALTGAALVFLLAVPAAHVLMLGTLIQLFTGWKLGMSVVVATLVGTLFLYKGGLLADVRVGILAFLMMYLGFGGIDLWCVTHVPVQTIWSQIPNDLRKFDGGQGWIPALSFFILGAWTLVDPGFHQRVSSAESPEVGRKGVLVSTVCWFVFDILSLTAGLYALVLLPKDSGGLTFFPELADRVLPSGIKGLFLCGLLGTITSAMVGYTLVSGATFGRDVVGRLRPALDDEEIKTWARVGFFISCVVAIALALSVSNVVVDLWYAYSGAVVGALIIPFCLAYARIQKRPVPETWVVGSMILAFLISFAWMIYGKRTNNDDLEVYVAGQRFSVGTLLPGLIVSGVILGLGKVLGQRKSEI